MADVQKASQAGLNCEATQIDPHDPERGLESLRQKLEEKESWYSGKLASMRSSQEERESQLRVDLTSMSDKWKEEHTRRTTAEETISKLESEMKSWRTSTAKYRRKVGISSCCLNDEPIFIGCLMTMPN